jgi:hypothetical protein
MGTGWDGDGKQKIKGRRGTGKWEREQDGKEEGEWVEDGEDEGNRSWQKLKKDLFKKVSRAFTGSQTS